mgnify:CR=1 FL=1
MAVFAVELRSYVVLAGSRRGPSSFHPYLVLVFLVVVAVVVPPVVEREQCCAVVLDDVVVLLGDVDGDGEGAARVVGAAVRGVGGVPLSPDAEPV